MPYITKEETLTVKDISKYYPAKLPYNAKNHRLAEEALNQLWEERLRQRDIPSNGSRAGSCKFAALLARSLFGGKLAGNGHHVFVVTKEGQIIDLNSNQPDVVLLGEKAHARFDSVLKHIDYRESLTSCLERVRKYEQVVLEKANN